MKLALNILMAFFVLISCDAEFKRIDTGTSDKDKESELIDDVTDEITDTDTEEIDDSTVEIDEEETINDEDMFGLECKNGEKKTENGVFSECYFNQWIVRRMSIVWGTDTEDLGKAVALDKSGNIFVTGDTWKRMDGSGVIGTEGVFLTKLKVEDKLKIEWTKQWGRHVAEAGDYIAIDEEDNVYVSGTTHPFIDEGTWGPNYGFLSKRDNDGNEIWYKEWGSKIETEINTGGAIAFDSSENIFLNSAISFDFGHSYDRLLTKLDPFGERIWSKQWGPGITSGDSIIIDEEDLIFMSGYTAGSFDGFINPGERSPFVTKWNPAGENIWNSQWGTVEEEYKAKLVLDSYGDFYVAGNTYGVFENNEGFDEQDLYISKLSSEGKVEWTKQLGTDGVDCVYDIAIKKDGSIFLAGNTNGNFDGAESNSRIYEMFLVKLDRNGNIVWIEQWGAYEFFDKAISIVVNDSGNIVVTGYVIGSLDGIPYIGGKDIFVSIIFDNIL